MRDDQIKIKPFEFLEVRHFSMIKKENEHAVVSFAVQIADEQEEAYMKLALEEIQAEVTVLQTLEEAALTRVLEEAKKNDVAKAAALLKEASETTPALRDLSVSGVEQVVEGMNLMLAKTEAQKTISGKFSQMEASFADRSSASISSMDVMNALPLTQVLKNQGVQRVHETLNAMKDSGVFRALSEKKAEEVAKTDAAAEAIHQESTLLMGIVTELSVRAQNGVKILSGVVKSGTCLLDVTPHIRSWQAKEIRYSRMLDTLLEPYAKQQTGYIMRVEDEAIESFVLQYEETDWEFAKRMASYQHSFLVADDLTAGICFYYGMPKPRQEEVPEIVTNSYGIQKRLVEYIGKKDKEVPEVQERDAMYYTICVRDVYYVGDTIRLNGQELRVSQIESSLRGGEIYHKYWLKTENGFNVPRRYNEKAIGISLAGTILEPAKDVVKVTLKKDENREGCETRWFAYSTVYSSPDGTGWYCMPEAGDAIRLYVPGDDEREAYVISAVHLANEQGLRKSSRTNPDHKSIMNKYGKEVLFTPHSIRFTNNKGMAVCIIDGSGIEITSDHKVEISSMEAVEIKSEESSLKIIAPKSIMLIQNGTTVLIKENIVLEGNQTNIQ